MLLPSIRIEFRLLFEKRDGSPGRNGQQKPVGITRAGHGIDRVVIRLQVSFPAFSQCLRVKRHDTP